MINIDLVVAGCNTQCRHCYVNGGPGKMMQFEDAVACIEKLDEIASYLPSDVSFTLDHEPMNHPQIDKILTVASNTRHIQNYHHGMTTGIGLMRRKDQDAVVQSYLDKGYDIFGITIHGNAEHHDEIVSRKGAFETALEAIQYLREKGARIEISLMFNRHFAEDADVITKMLDATQPDYINIAIPIFIPHTNMLKFEPYRGTLDTLDAIQEYLPLWKQDKSVIVDNARKCTPLAAAKELARKDNLKDLFARPQDEVYLTVHHDCKMYFGNSGAETQCLGDLRYLDAKETARLINSQPGNGDYGAFYDFANIPSTDRIIEALRSLPQNYIYGDFASVLYRGLVELNVPTIIL